ncbi:glycerate kinase [Bifidobacterium sp. MA2]|uniref:Glycerate kinase n=1 Tax=Bifidobacterium santillanense TaxID=2809028 RepID=A0ABS5UPL5_9BIFI|nr:glycerate kinase [Bifidobacterium santillanense]MBT1172750.1 glycerate kinase [Bifidobacterium santillanense]
MTRYLCAPDSFKESLTAMEAAQAMARGIKNADPEAEVRCLPMADGGEGTTRALVDATGGTMHTIDAHDPLGRPVRATFGLLGDGSTAVVETAEASGLALLKPEERDPLVASSYGTGELIRAALDAGAKRILVGLGGSATNDAGAGILQALGAKLLDGYGRELAPGGAVLAGIDHIDLTGLDARLKDVEIVAACDVTNPLTGPNGASAVFGPQKGASPDDVALLDKALTRFAIVVERQLDVRIADRPGAGAAGGIGAAMLSFLHARFMPGIDLVIEQSGLDEAARWADVVLTGEGSIDFQTKFGKTPAGVARTAKRHGKPVIAIAGHIGRGIGELHAVGIDAVFGIAPGAATLDDLLKHAADNVAFTAEQVARTLALGATMH